LNPYCKGFSTKASFHRSVGPASEEVVVALRVKGCNAKVISRGFQKFSIVTLFVTFGRRSLAIVVKDEYALRYRRLPCAGAGSSLPAWHGWK
jgi:hypothetical protein